MRKMNTNLKKKIVGFAFTTMILASSVIPTYAATAQFTFTRSGNNYGITTQASGYSGYVTAWAKVTNTGTYKYNSQRNRYAATATAVKTISKSSYVSRTGGAIPQ